LVKFRLLPVFLVLINFLDLRSNADNLQSGAPEFPLVLHKPAPVEGYTLNPNDNGLVYNPLTREAQKTGQLRDPSVATVKRTLTLGDTRLEIAIPDKALAYETIPVPYRLFPGKNTVFPTAVEAVAFEDEKNRQGRDLFDLSLPGKIDLSVDYVGSMTAHLIPNARHLITPDFTDTPKTYPNFVRGKMTHSGVVEAGDLVWFKFRFTNTGNTIIDGQGLGGALLYPKLFRKDPDGVYRQFATTQNLFYRILDYWYPGKVWEPWIIFNIVKPGEPTEYYALEPGDYKIQLDLTFRSYQKDDTLIDLSDGPTVFSWEQAFTVAAQAKDVPVAAGNRLPAAGDIPNKMPTFIHTFEQFMTSFDCYSKLPVTSGDAPAPLDGVLHLQVAPWTKQVVVRLISGKIPAVTTTAIPIDVDSDSLSIHLPTKLLHTLPDQNGNARPIFETQTMADMRTNVQVGPYPEKAIVDNLSEMKSLGINLIQTTSMPWEFDTPGMNINYAGDALKYSLDVARQLKLQVGAWGQYPFDRATIGTIASWISGQNYSLIAVPPGIGGDYPASSQVDPRIAEANGQAFLFNFHRWGDLYHQDSDGTVPINIEDTRGWLREDINIRYPVGPDATKAFRTWLKARYLDIEPLNQAWGTSFSSFDDIDPETHAPDHLGAGWGYDDPAKVFHDWAPAVEDFDIWRTLVRIKNYRDLLATVGTEIPNAKMEIRTEGGNAFIAGIDPETPNAHFRHAYYNQRRIGGIAEILDASGVVSYHGDYTTIPYTPSEMRQIVRTSVSQGITPAYLPQFNDMRDIAINPKYGRSYQLSYNLDTPQMGFMMHVLQASYPWYQATVEEGGIPGVLWEDFECDGYVTETQKQELRFYQKKIDEALAQNSKSMPQSDVPSQEWKKRSHAMRSYDFDISKDQQSP
jgi:Beta-galactosidase